MLSPSISKVVNGKQKYSKGWMLFQNKGKFKGTKYKPNSKTEKTLDTYIHIDGSEWFGNPSEFCEKFSLNWCNVYKLRTGRISKYRGWKLRPADDEDLPMFAVEATESLRRYA